MWIGYVVAVLIHGIYNFPIGVLKSLLRPEADLNLVPGLAAMYLVASVAALLVAVIWVVFLVRKLRREQDSHQAIRGEMQ
jgi:hypothetical protein